ncbi:MAG: hypothetical protein QOE92_2048 [Chloroflexota bacterium]|jgi:hypothetical protein|nr:hypothetical protein [Chloroflexota bacterium]
MQDYQASSEVESPSRGTPRSRALLLGLLAIITPAGLVLVNVAAYVMSNLAAFRVAITVSAVVSTVILNGLTGITAYRLGASRWPDAWVFAPHLRRAVTAEFILALALGAAIGGQLTYQGLSDPAKLPNLSTFIAGLIGLAIPILLAAMLRDTTTRRQRRRYRVR